MAQAPDPPAGFTKPEGYLACRCQFCMCWSTEKNPITGWMEKWWPLIPWASGSQACPKGLCCLICANVVRLQTDKLCFYQATPIGFVFLPILASTTELYNEVLTSGGWKLDPSTSTMKKAASHFKSNPTRLHAFLGLKDLCSYDLMIVLRVCICICHWPCLICLVRFMKQRETLIEAKNANPGMRILNPDQLGPRELPGINRLYFDFGMINDHCQGQYHLSDVLIDLSMTQ